MDRRRFLSLTGAGIAAATLDPRLALAESDARARFAAAMAEHPWLLGWADARPREGWQAAQIEGEWPASLSGTLYRNGPGLFRRGDEHYQHWFDGDGLLQAWRIGASGIRHRALFIPTPKYRLESASGRFEVPAIGTRIASPRGIRNSDDLNTANTAVIEHAGSLYALWEGGSPFRFDADSLAPHGLHSWGDGLEHLPFSAHPLHEADGTLWNFGLLGKRLLVWRIDRKGAAAEPKVIELPFPGFLHAFSMNARYLVFVVMPYVLGEMTSGTPYFEALAWEPQRGCRALVLDKQDLDRARWFGLPAGAAYHYGPMRQHGDTLVLSACWNPDGEAMRSPLADAVIGQPAPHKAPPGCLQPIALDLRSGRVAMHDPLPLDVDFPVWDEASEGQRMFAPLNSGRRRHPYFDQLAGIDAERGVVDRYDFGDHVMVEEHRYVPAADGRGPGWLLGTVLDVRRRRSGLAVFDAGQLAAGPRALAWLGHSLPLGFHGWFSPA